MTLHWILHSLEGARKTILLGALGLLVLGACQPKIGDDCLVDLDCSQVGDRICDTTQPNGYCTIFNCGPTTCPEDESVCVAFSNTPSEVAGCGNLGRTSPYARPFCMKSCEDDGDCRDGYVCLDITEDNPWGADLIEQDPKSTHVCVLPSSAEEIPRDRVSDLEENVCRGPAIGAGGADGGGGAGGASD